MSYSILKPNQCDKLPNFSQFLALAVGVIHKKMGEKSSLNTTQTTEGSSIMQNENSEALSDDLAPAKLTLKMIDKQPCLFVNPDSE